MFYEFFVSYLTLVINFLKDRGSEEQILRALTYQFHERSRARSAKRVALPRDSIKFVAPVSLLLQRAFELMLSLHQFLEFIRVRR